MYAVFDVKPEAKANGDAVLQDDVVSRQSIAVREGRALGFPDHGLLYLIEGAESVLARAEGHRILSRAHATPTTIPAQC